MIPDYNARTADYLKTTERVRVAQDQQTLGEILVLLGEAERKAEMLNYPQWRGVVGRAIARAKDITDRRLAPPA